MAAIKNIALFALLLSFLTFAGCVERRLTINTNPQDALIELNDEEIGRSPVTVSFNWYGDYNVRATKTGYATLKTNKVLKRPMHDRPPFDFIAGVLNPKKIVDSYEWTFDLAPMQTPERDDLIKDAINLQKDALQNTK